MTDEHERYAGYLLKLANVDEAGEVALVRTVLNDPDRVMADSAVVGHLNLKAAELLEEPGFADWARRLAPVVDDRPLPALRLREWNLLRSVAVGEPWQESDLIEATDWFQRWASAKVADRAALAVLAERGRTRRVRAAAVTRLAALERV